jgi:hypothetical protein
MTDQITQMEDQATDPQVDTITLQDFARIITEDVVRVFSQVGEQIAQTLSDPATVAAIDKVEDLIRQYKALQPSPLTRSQLDELPKGKRRVISLQPRRQPHTRSPRKSRSPSLITHRR